MTSERSNEQVDNLLSKWAQAADISNAEIRVIRKSVMCQNPDLGYEWYESLFKGIGINAEFFHNATDESLLLIAQAFHNILPANHEVMT